MPPRRAADPRPRGALGDPRGWLRGWRADGARRAGLRAGPPGVARGRDAAGRGPGRGLRGAPGCRGHGGWRGGWRLCSCCWPCWPPAACFTAGLAPRPGPAGTALPGPASTAPRPRRVSWGKSGARSRGCRRYPATRRWSICLAMRRRSAAPAAKPGTGMEKAGCAAEHPRTGGMQRSLQCRHPRERCWMRWDGGQNGILDVMGHWPQRDAGCYGMLQVGSSQEGCNAGHWGPQDGQDSRKAWGHAIRWVQLEDIGVCSTTGLRDTRLPYRDEQPWSCCLPPCCGLDKKRAELPSALLQWLPRVNRTSREPAQRKVAARDNACVGGSWLGDITSCMMTSLRYNDVKERAVCSSDSAQITMSSAQHRELSLPEPSCHKGGSSRQGQQDLQQEPIPQPSAFVQSLSFVIKANGGKQPPLLANKILAPSGSVLFISLRQLGLRWGLFCIFRGTGSLTRVQSPKEHEEKPVLTNQHWSHVGSVRLQGQEFGRSLTREQDDYRQSS